MQFHHTLSAFSRPLTLALTLAAACLLLCSACAKQSNEDGAEPQVTVRGQYDVSVGKTGKL